MRAIEPSDSGHLDVRGFRLGYEVFGDAAAPPVLLLPTWQIAPSRHWRMQVPYLARSRRVITLDPPGIGGGERTSDPAAFELDRVVDYAVGLLDHVGVDRADVIGLSMGGSYGLWMGARYPERVRSLILMGTVAPEWAYGDDPAFWEPRERYEGWERRNAHYWRAHYEEWLQFFFAKVCSEPHSTKAIDDFVGWARQTTPEILVASVINPALFPRMPIAEAIDRVRCPVLIVHGTDDRIADIATARMLAEARPDWGYVELEESGHAGHGRDPVRTNLLIGEFLGVEAARRRTLRRAPARRERRALLVSSPIGLGHVQRDLAIARELRRLAPDLRIDWLAQHPVSRVLEEAGETIHPLSAALASESAHWESSAAEHRLHCFFAFREMDEILAANFMVFLEAVRETPYDLWIGDEAWEVDHFLHENPELKSAPYVFLTDFLGWLPVTGDPREAELCADYNAEMLEQVARYPRVRDRALYLGEPDDLIDASFGPGLPSIREWAAEHFEAVGYAIPFDPAGYADNRALKARLGHDPDRPLVIATVGGTSAGRHLLGQVAAAWPRIAESTPEARCMMVAGPRIAPDALGGDPGIEVRSYVHNLYEHLACCDLAITQGGLGTTMELALTRRPFLYVPLRDHCEQQVHVAHRLDRHRAGRRLGADELNHEALAEVASETLGADTSTYLAHRPGAARRAAERIAELL